MREVSHITHVVPRFLALTGGETAVLHLTKELARLGVRSTILTRAFGPSFELLRDPSIEIRTCRFPWKWLTGHHLVDCFLDVWLAPALLSLTPQKTDGYIFHADASPFALWWAKKVRRTHLPCVYFCYQPPQFAYYLLKSTMSGYSNLMLSRLLPAYAWVHRWFDKRWVRTSDMIWSFSKSYAQWCHDLYGFREVEAITPGIDYEHFSGGNPAFVRKDYQIPAVEILLLTVNKLIPRKNITSFIDLIAWLKEKGHPCRGIIAGDGPLRTQLQAYAAKKQIHNEIIFAGYVEYSKLPNFYAGADAYIFLEQNVPFGMTPLEAAAAGTPTVALRGGGTAESVVHGTTGYLADASLRVPEIGGYVLDIVKNPQTAAEMRLHAREHARQFTWQRYTERVRRNFSMLISKTTPESKSP